MNNNEYPILPVDGVSRETDNTGEPVPPLEMSLDDFSNPGVMEAKVSQHMDISAAAREVNTERADMEQMTEVSAENKEMMFTNVEGEKIIAQESDAVAEAIANSVEAGKIPGFTLKDLEKPGMSGFPETPLGRKVMGAIKAMALATALVAPMKNAHADGFSDIFRDAAVQGVQMKGNEASNSAQLEARLASDHQQLESRLANGKLQLESGFKQQLASMNERHANELMNFDTRVQTEMLQWKTNSNMTQAQKDIQLMKYKTDRQIIEARQEGEYKTWATITVPAARERYDNDVRMQQEQFKAYVETQRGQASGYSQANRAQIGTNLQTRVLNELFKR